MQSLLMLYVVSVLLYGLLGKHWQVNGFGFGPPSVPLSVAASSPFPFGPFGPSPFGPSPFCPSPFLVLAPSFAAAPVGIFSPYPPPPPHFGLFDALLQAILAKKGQFFPPPYPYPPPPPYYPPQFPRAQEHLLKVHITKDLGDDKDYDHHDHWHEEEWP